MEALTGVMYVHLEEIQTRRLHPSTTFVYGGLRDIECDFHRVNDSPLHSAEGPRCLGEVLDKLAL